MTPFICFLIVSAMLAMTLLGRAAYRYGKWAFHHPDKEKIVARCAQGLLILSWIAALILWLLSK